MATDQGKTSNVNARTLLARVDVLLWTDDDAVRIRVERSYARHWAWLTAAAHEFNLSQE